MRALVRLTARRAAAYDNAYHHKLRGRIWGTLADTHYIERHDAGDLPGFVYSNPFPPRDMQEGDERTLLVASPNEELLANVAADLLEDRELNIGEMPFHVEAVTPIEPDVGPPGSTGVMSSGTGILVRIPPRRCADYGIEHPATDGGDAPGNDETDVFWRPEHTTRPFFDVIESNLDHKHDALLLGDRPGPADVDGDLFDSYELIKTFAVPLTVTPGETHPHVLSKWEFGYTVRNEDHRRHLNLALDAGLGHRNSLGLGFMNLEAGGAR